MLRKYAIYQTLQEMYEEYSLADCIGRLTVEGHAYELVGTTGTDVYNRLQVFRCEKEQHNLLVYMRGCIPYLIKPIYSINGISMEEASMKHK